MAVAPAFMADKIIVLDDDDEEESPQPSTAASRGSSRKNAKLVSPLKAKQPAPTHITQSPFASAKKEAHVLQVENEKLFNEFVEHCTAHTQDCPDVITFLKTKHTKASPIYLSSVEFRNFLGRCLTRAQANRSKTFVYINELCTVLRQHGIKKRQSLSKPEPSTSKSASNEHSSQAAEEEEQPSTSGVNEDSESDRKTARKSKKQIAYLENLLKVYNDEIHRLQEADLSLDDLGSEDSLYIQEHKLKRKMMKIYEKLCELKGCSTLTGRVLEQRISYSGSRYPEINKRIEKFINGPEARENPPDYLDIYQQVVRANERYSLCLTRKQLGEIAKEAFRDTASRIQDRRHLDLVYNFGSHVTDNYKPACDPALENPTLLKRLRSNRELAINRLEDVITKYATRQDDAEEQERLKRSKKDKTNKEANGVEDNEEEEEEPDEPEEEEPEEEEDEEDQSSDPDIEEEIHVKILNNNKVTFYSGKCCKLFGWPGYSFTLFCFVCSRSDTDIPLDMGVYSSPQRPRAETPPYVSSSQSTPPPKKNKVNVATQCDPQEVIELSDSD
uniref:Death domain-associated protein 6 n=1 Tax=Periophthalmus magnuspinnatus TaxID=409849 RepID=A0A3B4BN36_9GOBI